MKQADEMKKEFVMAEYKNMMENLVEDEYGRAASSLGCSTCDICRSDIIAYALNLLPPKYVVTRARCIPRRSCCATSTAPTSWPRWQGAPMWCGKIRATEETGSAGMKKADRGRRIFKRCFGFAAQWRI